MRVLKHKPISSKLLVNDTLGIFIFPSTSIFEVSLLLYVALDFFFYNEFVFGDKSLFFILDVALLTCTTVLKVLLIKCDV